LELQVNQKSLPKLDLDTSVNGDMSSAALAGASSLGGMRLSRRERMKDFLRGNV
jgi:hypothetical protein